MPTSPKIFYSQPPSSRILKFFQSQTFSVLCLLIGLFGVLFGSVSLFSKPRICGNFEPRSVKISWEKGVVDAGLGGIVGSGSVNAERRKVMGFVGIQTGFGSTGRRRSLRNTWFPSDRDGLKRVNGVGVGFDWLQSWKLVMSLVLSNKKESLDLPLVKMVFGLTDSEEEQHVNEFD